MGMLPENFPEVATVNPVKGIDHGGRVGSNPVGFPDFFEPAFHKFRSTIGNRLIDRPRRKIVVSTLKPFCRGDGSGLVFDRFPGEEIHLIGKRVRGLRRKDSFDRVVAASGAETAIAFPNRDPVGEPVTEPSAPGAGDDFLDEKGFHYLVDDEKEGFLLIKISIGHSDQIGGR